MAVTQNLLQALNADFHVFHSLNELPKNVQNYLNEHIKDTISPVDGAFRATDVIIDPNIPTRRLLLAGIDANLFFVWYEHGGRGYHHHIVVLEESVKSVNLVYATREYYETKEIFEIQKLIAAGLVDEETFDVQKHGYW
ncbi:hypothetical protein [Paraglaciecola sp. 25GB23A]|uniref:hypothetical protein n=1 Tax=Paraglaciecola sp. 25GB23A TaxID=3156068 RepID=UPI0032AF5FEE